MRPVRPAVLALAVLAAAGSFAGCRAGVGRGRVGSGVGLAGTGSGAGGGDLPPPPPPASSGEKEILVENRNVGRITRAEFAEFNAAWDLFVKRDKGWKPARDAWLARGGAAPYVLAENLLRYFWSATAWGKREDIYRIADSARAAGEPAVGYFANVLVLDDWPLKEPVTVQVQGGERKTVTVWKNDDVTRQHLAIVLAGIGLPSVPRLTSPAVLRGQSVGARRYAMYALGSIGSDPAVDALGGMLGASDWQDRASAAKPLLEAAVADSDPFVRKKVEEALSGKGKSEF
jgi:hypothetical protein